MSKEQFLDIIKLLSALESWSFSVGRILPDYLIEKLETVIEELSAEVLK